MSKKKVRSRTDSLPRKGKKCPGGYWIPRDKECGGTSLPGTGRARSQKKKPMSLGNLALGAGALGAAGLYAKSVYDLEQEKKKPPKRGGPGPVGKTVGEYVRGQEGRGSREEDPAAERLAKARKENAEAVAEAEAVLKKTASQLRDMGYDPDNLPTQGKGGVVSMEEHRKKKAGKGGEKKDSAKVNLFVDAYPRWDSSASCFSQPTWSH